MKKEFNSFFRSYIHCNISPHKSAKNAAPDGEWTISSIALEDNSIADSLQTTPVFEDAVINCLINSHWDFAKKRQRLL